MTDPILLSLAVFALCGTFLAARRPNIIVILTDDLGFSDIGSFGAEINTPNLDALARDGLSYTQFYNAARCCPTRASLLTGVYPHQAGIGHMVDGYAERLREALSSSAYSDRLSPNTPTIPEVLRTSGYRTFMTGKWHIGYRPAEWPVERGFDRSFTMIEGAGNYYGYGPQLFSPNGKRENVLMAIDRDPYTPPRDGFFTTDAFTDYARDFIEEHGDRDQPYFLYLAYNAPHWPLHARPETIAKYRGKYKAGWDKLRAERYERLQASGIIAPRWPIAPRPEALPAWDELSPEKQDTWDEWMSVYAAQIEEMDAGVGRLMASIRKRADADNTLVLFLSDNGGAAERPVNTIGDAKVGTRDSYEGYDLEGAHFSSSPFRKTKKYTHEGGISTPLIAWWPQGIDPSLRGKLNHEPGHIIDLMATFLDLAGAELPREWNGAETTPVEGISLAPTFSAKPLQRSQPIFWEHEGHRAVRDGKWKIVASFEDPWELYDVEADRTESHDLAATEPEILSQLAAKYDAWTERTGVRPWITLPPAK